MYVFYTLYHGIVDINNNYVTEFGKTDCLWKWYRSPTT